MSTLQTDNIEINDKFQHALDKMNKSMDNIFITGKAGTGKSTLLNYFLKQNRKKVAVLAPTGVAALNVNGETIHSFFKFKPNITPDVAAQRGSKQTKNKIYTNLETIIIDEISMVRADLLDCVDAFLQESKRIYEPFGGVQVIFIGDLYQLPPVVTSYEKFMFSQMYKSPWFFDSNVFKSDNCYIEIIELDKIYRQKDNLFIEVLNAIRSNQFNHQHLSAINQRIGGQQDDETIYLTSTNAKADQINKSRLSQLPVESKSFKASTKGKLEMKQFPTDTALELKVGAQVMFVNNDSVGRWVNGSLGKIQKIQYDEVTILLSTGKVVEVKPHTWEIYKHSFDENSNSVVPSSAGSFTQIPVKLAWAITIHKSQGKTFEKVIIDLGSGSFASGQTYVALSRCTTLDGISLVYPLKRSDIIMDARIDLFLAGFTNDKSDEEDFEWMG
jgi:hypothetical protein